MYQYKKIEIYLRWSLHTPRKTRDLFRPGHWIGNSRYNVYDSILLILISWGFSRNFIDRNLGLLAVAPFTNMV